MSRWITEYKLVKWESPEELVQALKDNSDNDWRTELSRVYHEKGDSGWTVFSRSHDTKPDFMQMEIPFRELYRIINGEEFKEATKKFDEAAWPYQTSAGSVIDTELKAYYARAAEGR